jgi:cobalt-precorrin-5B (C1)-methyltransferase
MTDDAHDPDELPEPPEDAASLRRGWTTGTCATGATRAALQMLLGREPEDPVPITLPSGAVAVLALARIERTGSGVRAGIIKDAGDDPDVTHGALVWAEVRWGPTGSGISFEAGEGVGTVTLEGLPIPPGEPAINPVPRQMMRTAVAEVMDGATADLVIRVGIENGEKLARRTMNGRLGIVGGLSILGTTGIVIPFSCAAWINSIHRGIDVARALGLTHVAAATGDTSEKAVQALYGLSEQALIDMGDFAGGTLKYLRQHPVARVTIAGGIAKMAKLGQGLADLHSARGSIDHAWLAARMAEAGGTAEDMEVAVNANTVVQIHDHAAAKALPFADRIAAAARVTALRLLDNPTVALDICVFDRAGRLIGRAG